MRQQQLIGDPHNNAITEFNDRQSGIWTAIPGIIQSFSAEHMTCTAQPAIMAKLFNDGTVTDVALPLLVDCPVQFPAGGGCSLTFPVASGDECLVVFSSRCIDAWWQSGGVQTQAEMRMHDLSDGFVLLGVRSIPRVIPSISATAVQLRSDDGLAFVELNPTTHAVNITSPGDTNITGNLNVTGTITATVDVVGGGKHLKTHVHSGVQSGGSNTGAPV